MIDPGTAGSRELEETALSIIAHAPVTPKASLRTGACCAVPSTNCLGPCGSGNRLVPQISAQFKRSVYLFSHGELDPRHERTRFMAQAWHPGPASDITAICKGSRVKENY